jgi:hypothetical protein
MSASSFHRRNARRDQLLDDRLAQLGNLLNRRGRSAAHRLHLLLDFLALLFLALDVDLPAQQLRRQADVLALLADRQRQLRVVDDHFQLLVRQIHNLTRLTFAGCSAFSANVVISSLNSMMSIFSPRSSRMIDCTRMPFMPTHAPTGSTSLSRDITAILVRSPASRAIARIVTVPS